jgi:diacylglycerol kinase
MIGFKLLIFIKKRIAGVFYALKGMIILASTEHSVIAQLTISVFFTGMGFYYNITTLEWLAQIIIIGLILCAEGLNTAIEKLADYIQPDHDLKIGLIKDIAAGAVCFAALAGLSILGIIYIPRIF